MLSDIELLAGLGLWREIEHTPRTRTSSGWWLAPLRRALAGWFRRGAARTEFEVVPGLWLADEDDWRMAA